MDIESRTKRSLEWERLKSYLAAESCSQWSRELCLGLEAHTDSALVQLLLGQTDEALAMLSAGFGLSQEGLPELREVIARLRTGAQLAASELLDLRKMLVLSKRMRWQVDQMDESEFPCLLQFQPEIIPHADLVDSIDQVFDEAGNIRDDASALLGKLRRDVHRLNNQSRDELSKIINSSTLAKALQEPIYTQRNGRYVLPVQVTSRHSIQGIVHDSSASGLTVYIEPMAVVELTNKIRLKEAEIEREIDRLLSALTAKAYDYTEDLERTNVALAEVDFIAARARLAHKYRGIKPALSSDGALLLRSARHPLLVLKNLQSGEAVVANDIVLGGDVRTLVITGPNTGGKTVFLKTAGLLSLMVRGGLLLPCEPGSTAVIFHQVFADVGDEQSIEQSLSTFSSHMTNIIEVINRSDDHTLALLDEVGAGTDPREGAILARVVLEQLNSVGACTISTTHYGELKTLGYTTSGFVNGSFEFDDASLSPTYRLRIGVPGSSKAITIAARLGMRRDLIEAAQTHLNADTSDLQSMIEELEARLGAVDLAEQELKVRQELMREEGEKNLRRQEELEREREKLRAGVADKMQRDLEDARELVRSLIADLQKAPSIAKAQRLQKDLEVIRQDLGWLEPQATLSGPALLTVGQSVKVRSLNQKAVIEGLPDDLTAPDAQVTVRAGSFKIKVAVSDIQPLQQQGPAAPHHLVARTKFKSSMAAASSRPQTARVSSQSPGELQVFVRSSRNTLDLRGQRVDEGLQNLASFVDTSFLDHLSPLMIIHGHGTGKMKSAVRKFLADCPYNASLRPGETYEGGDGVTVVQFR